MMKTLKLFYLQFIYSVMAFSQNTTTCTPQSYLFWKHMWPFVENARVVNILGMKDASLNMAIEIMSCGVQQSVIPIVFTLREITTTLPTESKTIEKPLNTSTGNASKSSIKNECYMFFFQDASTIKQRIKKMSGISSDSKIILNFLNITRPEVDVLLKNYWKKFKLLNLLVAVHLSEYSEVSVFNPFLFQNDQHGYILKIQLEDNTVDVLNNFIDSRLYNVNKYPLYICMFTYKGSAAPDVYGENHTVLKYDLIDGEIMDALVQSTNFKPIYFEPSDGTTYGYKLPNGTLTGSIAEIESRKADILGNLKPIKELGQKNSEFLFPVNEMDFAFLSPKQGLSSTISFLVIFNKGTSASVALTYVCMLIIWMCTQSIYSQFLNCYAKKSRMMDLSFILFGAMLLVPQKERKLLHEKTLFTSTLIFGMVICYHYQGKMVELLTSSKRSLDIETVEDLAQSGLKILTLPSFLSLLKDIAEAEQGNTVYKKLYARQEISRSVDDIVERVVKKKDAVMLTTSYSCQYFRTILFSEETGEDLLHVSSDGPPQRYSSHLVPDNSPYSERFNLVLMRIRESGLVHKWQSDDFYDLQLLMLQRTHKFSSRLSDQGGIYTMHELWFIFVSWSVFCLFSVIVFIAEILIYSWCRA